MRFTRRRLSIASAYATLDSPSLGGVALFVGRVRDDRAGKGRVSELVYEAHLPMAHRAFEELEKRALSRFDVARVVLWHRLGPVPAGEASVIVGVAAGHRAPAFAACRYLIEDLKATAPIWKAARSPSSRGSRSSRGRAARR